MALANFKLFIVAGLAIVAFPIVILKIIPDNIRKAQLLEKAPR